MKRRLWMVFDLLICFMAAYALLWLCFAKVAYDDELYFELQTEAGVLDEAGIDAENLRMLDQRLALYLDGRMLENFLSVEQDGVEVPAFHEWELRHLEDCRNLMRSAWTLAMVGLIAISFRKGLFHTKEIPLKIVWLGFGLMFGLIGVFALWALIDFQSAFTFFHKLLFTNDLWLLDPTTDLLIRICPSSMFEAMGMRIGIYAAIALIGFPTVYTLLDRLGTKLATRKEKKK